MTTPAVFALSAHATYQCRHSGACCTAGWGIPVEAHLQPTLGITWLIPDADGTCPEYDRPSGLCRIHRAHGEAMLPESCYHFPRRARIDDRGIAVSLSLYCPTAAAMLLDAHDPLDIVHNPEAFPASRGYDGLDASGDWPPLLRPDVLFDLDSFAAWERCLVRTLADSPDTVASTLARIADTAERLREWTAESAPLPEWTSHVLADTRHVAPDADARFAPFSGPDTYARVCALVPSGLDAPSLPADAHDVWQTLVEPDWPRWQSLALRYLAATAFASWTAYQCRGVRAHVAELYVAAGVLQAECVRRCASTGAPLDRDGLLEAIRMSDLLLVHLVDRDALMDWLREVDVDA